MQLTEDQFNRRHPFFRVNINRHTTPIVNHFQRLIFIQDDVNPAGVTSQRLIDTVINNFLPEMIRTGGIGVHAGATTHRLKTIENLNGFGGISLIHDIP